MANGAAGMGPSAGRRNLKPGVKWPERTTSIRADSAMVMPVVLAAASPPVNGLAVSDFVLTGIVVAAAALALAGALWGLAEYQTTLHLRRALRQASAKSRAL